jgi:hypothetical protein
MTQYEYQAEIFEMVCKLYPEGQQNAAFSYVEKLWDADINTLKRHYQTMKEITK